MKEAYAVRRTVPPSAELEAQIDQLLAVGVGEDPHAALSQLAKLGARLIIQRRRRGRVRRVAGPRALRAPARVRDRHAQRLPRADAADRRGRALGGDPAGPRGRRAVRLQALSARHQAAADRAVEGVGDRRVRARAVDARRRVTVRGGRAGQRLEGHRVAAVHRAARPLPSLPAPRSLRDPAHSLFLDATFLAVRPSGPKEGVLVAWGFTDTGERVLLSVMLGMRESYEDWQALGRDLIARGLGAPMLIVADGAPGLIKAIEHCWPNSDRQHCAVHRLRNLVAKLPEPQRERVRQAYWQALDEALTPRHAKQRLQALVGELEHGGFSS